MPKVSVIVPNYNHAQFLKQRLDSIFTQTFQDFEVILLDDASTDKSIEILTEYAQNKKVSHFIINKKNSGSPFKQWKKGIDLAKGDYIWIAESDDWAELNFLEIACSSLEYNHELGLFYTQSYKVSADGSICGDWLNYTESFDRNILFHDNFIMSGKIFIQQFLIHKNVIPNASAVVFSLSAYYKSGGITDIIEYSGDWLLWIKILIFSNVYFYASKLNYFRYHHASVIATAQRQKPKDTYDEKHNRKLRKKIAKYINTFSVIVEQNNHYIDEEDAGEIEWLLERKKRLKAVFMAYRLFRRNRFYKSLFFLSLFKLIPKEIRKYFYTQTYEHNI